MNSYTSRKKSHVLPLLIFLALLGVGFLQWQNLADWWVLRYYNATPEIAGFAERGKYTDKGRAIFYFAKPKLDDKATFNADCQTQDGDLELGCYRNWRIYVLKINNAELAPVMDETAAHEMLHGAYVRLSSGERRRIDGLVERQANLLNDTDLNAILKKYEVSEPGQRSNELHSFLGTQFANLSPELEDYYKRYFSDRTAVVAAHKAYKLAFDKRKADLDISLAQITAMKAQLSSLNAQMDAHLRSGNIAAYNQLVPRQNQLVRDLKQLIDNYNQMVEEYNSLSVVLDSQQISPQDNVQ